MPGTTAEQRSAPRSHGSRNVACYFCNQQDLRIDGTRIVLPRCTSSVRGSASPGSPSTPCSRSEAGGDETFYRELGEALAEARKPAEPPSLLRRMVDRCRDASRPLRIQLEQKFGWNLTDAV